MLTPVERCPWCGSRITHAKFVQIQDAIRKDEQRKLAAAEKQIHERLAKEIAEQQKKLDGERAKILKQLELAKQEAEKLRRKEIAEVRAILQKDRDAALLKKDADFARERDALQKKIVEMSRRVRKPGAEVAEGGELDLYEALREAFPEDQISRTKGKTAGNLVHEVRYRGKSAGKILIDARPRAAWQHAFVTKLRQDQSDVGADQALLATSVFPAGKKELFVESGIIVVAPARAVAMIDVLRKTLIAMHAAKLTDAERTDKLSRLFRFITSSGFKRKLAEASELAAEALQIDVDEKRAHDNVWKKRGTVLTRIKNVLREIDTDVCAIVEAPPGPDTAGAKVLRPAAFRVTSND
ncbi:MAG TPA: DUF2130 domain-containing protein [Thermoanaerobaculia bacterium]|nr:DUF2130 domain-containing protein [Thermoanaerobaculia bacterium]